MRLTQDEFNQLKESQETGKDFPFKANSQSKRTPTIGELIDAACPPRPKEERLFSYSEATALNAFVLQASEQELREWAAEQSV